MRKKLKRNLLSVKVKFFSGNSLLLIIGNLINIFNTGYNLFEKIINNICRNGIKYRLSVKKKNSINCFLTII